VFLGVAIAGPTDGGVLSSSSSSSVSSSPFFRDGRDGDLQSIWSFGVNGFFIPPPDFAGVPGIAAGTIIPTSAVGLICFDGNGGCSLEFTAVVGGNLGRQIFNVTMNTIRFISSLCQARLSRLGRVIVRARLAEVSTRLLPTTSLAIPITSIIQLSSSRFGFIEFDTLFVLQGQLVRIERFVNLLRGNDQNDHKDSNGKDGVGAPGPGAPPGGKSGPGGPGTPGSAMPLGGRSGDGDGHRNNGNANSGFGFGVCPNLIDNTGLGFDGIGNGFQSVGGFGGSLGDFPDF